VGVKLPGLEVNHSSPSSTDVKESEERYLCFPTPLSIAFMTGYRLNFAFM